MALIYKIKIVRTNILWVYILVKLESCANDFQNHTATPTFFKNESKSRLFGKNNRDFPLK